MVKLNVSRTPGPGKTATTEEEWTRNPEWLTMPEIAHDSGKICVLVRVDENDDNYVNIYLNGSANNTYTIDWGDGSEVTTYNYNSLPEHFYDFNNPALDGTLTSDGYKQAIFTVTLNNTSDYFPYMDLCRAASLNTRVYYYVGKQLEVIVACPNLNNFRASTSTSYSPNYVESIKIFSMKVSNLSYTFFGCFNLKNIEIGDNITWYQDVKQNKNLSFMFGYCRELPTDVIHSVIEKLVDTPSSVQRTFIDCRKLRVAPEMDTSNTTDWYQTFYSCWSLEEVPLYDTSNVTRMQYAFGYCYILPYIPLLDLSSCTNIGHMFLSCINLSTVPKFNTSNVTYAAYTFQSCRLLETVPAFDLSSVTDMQSMFAYCSALKTLPDFDYSSVTGTGFTMTFYACNNLRGEITLNTNVTSLYRTFQSTLLEKVTIQGNFITDYIYACRETFNGCITLKEFVITGTVDTSTTPWFYRFMNSCFEILSHPTFDLSASTRNDNICTSNWHRTSLNFTNISSNFWIDNCNFDASELEDIFTNKLQTVSSGTIYIANNPGAATCDRSIATAKGWTVSG